MLKEYGGMQNGGTPSLQSSSRFTVTYYQNLHTPDTTREAFVTSKRQKVGVGYASDKCNGTSIPVSSFFLIICS